MGENMALAFGLIVILIYLLLLAYLIFAYVLQSIALHTLSRRRGIANPWLAWIPYGNYWIIGALARDYDKKNNINRRWDKVLLILSIAGIASFVVIYIALFVFVILNAISMEAASGTINEEAFVFEMLGGIIALYVALIAVMVVMMALQTLSYVCTYKIFESTVPEKALKYFLIYLLVPFAAPICLFLCRNKGYQHPDPLAYIYNPVDKDYSYYRPSPVVQTFSETPVTNTEATAERPQPEQIIESETEE